MPSSARPTRAGKVFATVAVIVTVWLVWKVIDYRMQPPAVKPASSPALGRAAESAVAAAEC